MKIRSLLGLLKVRSARVDMIEVAYGFGTVPLEAEDMELGAALAEDLADDVDGNAETDEEALDTDDDELDEELGIDSEESEGMHVLPPHTLYDIADDVYQSRCTSYHYILSCQARNR